MPRSTKPKRRPTRKSTRGPSEIAPGVFIGGWNDALGFPGARFCVLDEAPSDMPAATHVAIYDEATGRANRSNLDRLASGIQSARGRGQPVLVFCGHGVRRSPLAGAWYLRRSEGISLDQAFDRVRSVRPNVEHARAWVGNPSDLEGA